MNIRQEIEMEAVVHNRSIPSDVSEYMYEKNLDKLPDKYKYYSDSKQEYISIFDMQLHHFIRAFVLLQDTDATAIKNKLYEIKNLLEVA
jgi:UDP-N-acetylglucosamine pyrophosphorylase|tara:strand:- start:1 stop:267 length:267 start_codon:yes stop_codon:yes gene_type:complete